MVTGKPFPTWGRWVAAPATLVALGIGLCFLGCGVAGLEEEPSSGVPTFNCFKVAPIIVVGKIRAVRDIGPARRSRKAPHHLIGPVEITVAVENALKGTVTESTIRVFGFRWREEYVRGGGPFSPYPGDRCLFLLRQGAVRLRLLLDGPEGSYALRVYSGEHGHLDPGVSAVPGRAIPTVLLTLGSGADLAGFRGYLVSYAHLSMIVSNDHQWVVSLLKPLTQHPDAYVRAAAEASIEAIEKGKWANFDAACPAKLD